VIVNLPANTYEPGAIELACETLQKHTHPDNHAVATHFGHPGYP
jgi:hypothetical protein